MYKTLKSPTVKDRKRIAVIGSDLALMINSFFKNSPLRTNCKVFKTEKHPNQVPR